MITINEYEAYKGQVCIDCLNRDDFGAELDEFTGEFVDFSAFSRSACDICGTTLAGQRIGGTHLVKKEERVTTKPEFTLETAEEVTARYEVDSAELVHNILKDGHEWDEGKAIQVTNWIKALFSYQNSLADALTAWKRAQAHFTYGTNDQLQKEYVKECRIRFQELGDQAYDTMYRLEDLATD
jgi:hypothetical protein